MGNALPTSSTPAAGTEPAAQATPPAASETPADFGAWLDAQPEPIKALANQHTAGLKTALDAERAQRKELTRQLADLGKAAAEGSEAKKQLDALSAKLGEAEQRDAFTESALKANVDPKVLKLAFTAAKQDGLIDGKNRVDFETLKTAYPQLFIQPVKPVAPAATVAGGAGGGPIFDMNSAIRRAAGRA
jgi:hypothetical protein